MAQITQICPCCGNYVVGVHDKNFANKMTRSAVKKTSAAGTAAMGALVGGPIGAIIGLGLGVLAGEGIDEMADGLQDGMGGIEYDFTCPRCGYNWRSKEGEEEKVKCRVEHNQLRCYQYGMVIHMDFTIRGRKGKNTYYAVRVNDANGEPLKDTNGFYGNSGFVYTSGVIEAPYDNTECTDFTLFLPYHELHLNGPMNGLKLSSALLDEEFNVLMYSDEIEMNVNPKPVITCTIDHGITQNNELGMLVHTNLTVCGMNGSQGRLGLFFTEETGDAYIVNGEQLVVYLDEILAPSYESSDYNDIQIFVPYSVFPSDHRNGSIGCRSVLLDGPDTNGDIIMVSDFQTFYWT